jgi:hypothetical protein
MKRLIPPFVIGVVFVASGVMITPNTAVGQGVKVFSDFLQLREVVSEMRSKVPLNREWSLVYCECKNGKVIAIPVQGAAGEIDRLLFAEKSRDHGGCKTEARIMTVGPSEKRLEANRKKEDEAKRLKALDEERYRAWRSQQSSSPDSSGNRGSAETQWMSKEDYERHKQQEAADQAAAEKRARKERVDKLKDAAKEKIYRRILGEPEYVQPFNPSER